MTNFLQRALPGSGSLRLFFGLRFGLCGMLLFAALPPAFGQSPADLFRGTWLAQTPTDGQLIVLLKNEGIASYFWGDNADRTVYRGQWTLGEVAAEIRWADGNTMRLERGGAGFTLTAMDPGGRERYRAEARQLPPEVLGQWSKPPTQEDELRSSREQAQGFFGIWRIGTEAPEYVFVESDRSAASTVGRTADKPRGQRGQWARQGSELHLVWDDGSYAILREAERGFDYRTIPSGEIIEEDETTPRPTTRTLESNVPSDWMAAYRTERETADGGIAFADRKSAAAFYRGDWVIRRSDNRFERVALARFGGLSSSENPSLKGQWRLSGQDVFMRWDDGMRKILSPVGHGFVLYEYRPGRPLDGVPARVFPAAPADTGKFEAHLKDRSIVGQQMAAMAQAAGGSDANSQSSSWGRSFARWVWPFGGESTPASTDALLSEEFAPEARVDPWWWPFWSETEKAPGTTGAPEAEATVEATPKADAPTPAEPEAEPLPPPSEALAEAPDAAPDPVAAPERSKTRSKNWLWPFDI